MKQWFRVNCMVLKSYSLSIEAETSDEALEKVRGMTSSEIADEGSLKSVEVDYIEKGE